MIKKSVAVVLCLVSFTFGLFSSLLLTKGSASNSEIDRSLYVRYPIDDYLPNIVVSIFPTTKDKYYHDEKYLCFFSERYGYNIDPLLVSRYEAVERGYSPCPDCYFDEVKIH